MNLSRKSNFDCTAPIPATLSLDFVNIASGYASSICTQLAMKSAPFVTKAIFSAGSP